MRRAAAPTREAPSPRPSARSSTRLDAAMCVVRKEVVGDRGALAIHSRLIVFNGDRRAVGMVSSIKYTEVRSNRVGGV